MPHHDDRSRAFSSSVAAILGRLDLDDVAERVLIAALRTIPGYTRMPERLLTDEVLPMVRRNLDLFLACVLANRDPTSDELAVLRASAMKRGRDGVPLQDMIHAYRFGARVAWRTVLDAAMELTDSMGVSETAELADRVMQYIDSVTTAVAESYQEEREHMVSERERSARLLFDSLVAATEPVHDLDALAATIGFRLAATYRPFTVAHPGLLPRDHAQCALTLRARGLLAVTEGDRVSGLAPASADMATLGGSGWAWAVTGPATREDLRACLDDARILAGVGIRLGLTGRLDPTAVLPELLLAASPDLAAAVSDRVLGPLDDYARRRSPELLNTLIAFVDADLDRRHTAAQLHVHENTLDYRLRRIEELTGLDLGSVRDLTLAVLAIGQRRLTNPAHVQRQ